MFLAACLCDIQARQGRTTIVVAHRLSTVRTADTIVGMADGRVVEHGTHEELMLLGGVYATLINNQVGGANITSSAYVA